MTLAVVPAEPELLSRPCRIQSRDLSLRPSEARLLAWFFEILVPRGPASSNVAGSPRRDREPAHDLPFLAPHSSTKRFKTTSARPLHRDQQPGTHRSAETDLSSEMLERFVERNRSSAWNTAR